jgi:hypothetical protein
LKQRQMEKGEEIRQQRVLKRATQNPASTNF